MHRLFVAIRPPELIRDLLIDAMDESPDFRWQDDEQLHLTKDALAFTDVNKMRPSRDALAKVHPPQELAVVDEVVAQDLLDHPGVAVVEALLDPLDVVVDEVLGQGFGHDVDVYPEASGPTLV